MFQDETCYQINIGGFDLEWRLEHGICFFGGLPITSVPTNNALAELMARFHSVAGTARFLLALQAAGRESIESDWRIIADYADFRTGYAELAKSAATTGWGAGKIVSLDTERRRVVFAVEDGWEGRYQKALGVCWGSAMQAGKFAGYCERLFGDFCWPEQTRFIAKGDAWDEFVVEPSTRTIESELALLQALDKSGGKTGNQGLLPNRAEHDLSQAYEMLAESNASLEEEIQERIAASAQLREANEQIVEINEQLRREVNERNRAYEALASNEAVLSSIFSTAPVGIGLVINRAIQEANDYLCQMTGYSRAELLGRSTRRLYCTEEEFQRLGELSQGLSTDNSSFTEETQWRTRDGRILDIQVSASLIKANDPEKGITFIASDITERKESEAVIRESQAYNRLLFRDSHIPLVVMDSRTLRFTDCNQTAARVFGFESIEELLGKTPIELSPPEQYDGTPSAEAEESLIRECMDRGSVIFEWRHRRPSGELWDAEVHLMRYDHRGETFIHFSLQDITQRRQADIALRREKTFSETLIDGLPGIFFLYDSTLHLKRWSRAHEIATGFSAEELQDWYVGDWHQDPEERRLGVDHARELLETGISGQIETTLIDKTGQPVPYLISTTRLMTPEGAAMMGMGINITERKEAERALQESERKYRMLVEMAREAVWITDAQHRLTFSNASGAEMLGYEIDNLLGRPLTDFMFEDDLPTGDESNPLLAPGHASSHEQRFRHADGSAVWCIVAATPIIGSDGQYQGAFGMLMDITKRREAEQQRLEMERQLLHSQKLESLGVLAGGIAHDFNNLLMAISGNLDLATIDLEGDSPAQEFLEQAMVASRRASDLTRQLLAYSGKGRFVVECLDLGEVVKESSHLLRASIAKTATLKLDIEPELDLIKADAGQIQQVAMNLITNASEAIGDRPGVITIRTGLGDFTEDELRQSRVSVIPPAGRYAFLEVTDTGCGMDGSTLARLFEPFFTTKFTGRGLGLSAVLGIVRGHHGALMVKSSPGAGSVFRVLFPVCAGREHSPRCAMGTVQLEPARMFTGLALIVDDEKPVRRICRKFLGRLGFETLEAADGEIGLEVFQANADEINLVLLDLNMPRMDGITAFREMRRHRPELKVILCSGYNEKEATEQFCGEGLADFLQKPYSLRDLRQKIETVLQDDADDQGESGADGA